ncbi:MAG: DUF1015 domain-containing protein [Candidatus Latescibacterota bacterium]
MAHLVPFRGILYNEEKAGDLSSVMAPPYDVISPQMREELYEQTANNIVRIDSGKEYPGDNDQENCYTRAAELWEQWLKDGILIRDEQPAIYLCRETYTAGGEARVRTGFLAAVRLEELGSGSIKPHERTLSGPKVDRLNLLRATRANFNPIFGLYDDPSQDLEHLFSGLASEPPICDVADRQGNHHSLIRITDGDLIQVVTRKLAEKTVIIADGHHRYETALSFRNEQQTCHPDREGDAPYNYVMMYLTNLEHPGLAVLPTHRLLHKLADFDESVLLAHLRKFFEIQPMEDASELLDRMAAVERESEQNTFGLYFGHGDYFLLTLTNRAGVDALMKESDSPASRTLDVAIIHAVLIEHLLKMRPDVLQKGAFISYCSDAEKAVQMVDQGQHQLALFLNPTKVSQVKAITESGEVMPQKSTYFYPKLLTGLVMREAV